MRKKLSSEYYTYACGNFFRMPRFEKKVLFSDSLLMVFCGCEKRPSISVELAQQLSAGGYGDDDFLLLLDQQQDCGPGLSTE